MVKVIDAEPQVVSAVDQEPKENVGPKDQTLDPALMSLRELQTVFRKRVMRAGKKNLAIRLTQTAFSFLGSKDSQIESVVREALRNVLIEYEIKRKKIGGSSIIEPFKIFPARRLSLAIR